MDGTSVKVSICYIYRANIPCRFHNLSVCTSRLKYAAKFRSRDQNAQDMLVKQVLFIVTCT